MKGKDNRGYSMVELIVVIAIMAMLVSVLAPQYLKYVRESKITVDINNADQIAETTSVALADKTIPLTIPSPGNTLNVTAADLPNVDAFPESKVDSSYAWVVTVGSEGLDSITLGGYEIWPNPDDPDDGYRTNNS